MSKSDFEWPSVLIAVIVATLITFVVEQVFAANLVAGYIASYVGGHIRIERDQWIMLIQPAWLVVCITVTVALWGQSFRAYQRHATERSTKIQADLSPESPSLPPANEG